MMTGTEDAAPTDAPTPTAPASPEMTSAPSSTDSPTPESTETPTPTESPSPTPTSCGSTVAEPCYVASTPASDLPLHVGLVFVVLLLAGIFFAQLRRP